MEICGDLEIQQHIEKLIYLFAPPNRISSFTVVYMLRILLYIQAAQPASELNKSLPPFSRWLSCLWYHISLLVRILESSYFSKSDPPQKPLSWVSAQQQHKGNEHNLDSTHPACKLHPGSGWGESWQRLQAACLSIVSLLAWVISQRKVVKPKLKKKECTNLRRQSIAGFVNWLPSLQLFCSTVSFLSPAPRLLWRHE